jgi:hypothetical protein
MDTKIIALEELPGPFGQSFSRMMRMVPDRDKQDVDLRRLIAFRLKCDGESATRAYLLQNIREMIQCAYTGRLYDFLKNDAQKRECGLPSEQIDPPEPA